MRRIIVMALFCAAMIGVSSGVAAAGPITWTDWTGHVLGGAGSAAGTLPGVLVTYAGEVSGATQTAGATGNNYWNPATPYLSSTVGNAPPCCEIITLISGPSSLTFSTPVLNPIMAIVSLGQPGYLVTYDFDQPFTWLSDGPGYWGGPGTLTPGAGDTLTGNEGHGAIQFLGNISTINWTTSPSEDWHGFTIGVASVPDPASTLVLFGLAGAGLIGVARRRKSK